MKKLLSLSAFLLFNFICQQSFAQFICAFLNDYPTVTITPPSPMVCQGSAITLTANITDNSSSTFSYTWSTTGTNDTINPVPTTSGTYSVTIVDGFGCSSSATSFVVVNADPVVSVASQSLCKGSTDTLIAVVTDASSTAYTYAWSTGSTIDTIYVSPSSNSVYIVNVIDGNGCTGNAKGNITVNKLPVVSVNNSTACGGTISLLTASVTDSSSSSFTYLWNTTGTNDTIDVAPLDTSYYSVVVTDSNGCVGTGTDTVNVLPLPVVSFDSVGFGNPVCQGSSPLTLTGASPPGGSYSGTNVSSGQFTPSSAGNFSILYTYTNGSGCTDTASYLVTVQVCTGTNPVNSVAGIETYPTPATDNLFIKFNSYLSNSAKIEFTDVSGRILTQSSNSIPTTSILPIDISMLPEGLYFVKITTDKSSSESKFIKQR